MHHIRMYFKSDKIVFFLDGSYHDNEISLDESEANNSEASIQPTDNNL